MVLDLPISRQWRVRDRLEHAQGKGRREGRRALPHRRRRPAAARGRRADGHPGRQGGEVHRHLQRRDPQLRRPGLLDTRSTPTPASSTRPGSRSSGRASISANAPSCAARATATCRSSIEVVSPAQFAAWVASKGGTMPGAKPAAAPDSTGSLAGHRGGCAAPRPSHKPTPARIRRRSSSPRPTRPRRPRIKSGTRAS